MNFFNKKIFLQLLYLSTSISLGSFIAYFLFKDAIILEYLALAAISLLMCSVLDGSDV